MIKKGFGKKGRCHFFANGIGIFEQLQQVDCWRIRFGKYGRICIPRITFQKMSICLIFLVSDENFPYFLRYTNVSHYTKIYSRKNDSCVLQIASTVNARTFSNYHADPTTTGGQPRKSCSDSAGHFLRSWICP
jgi:hypothetical protein